ncbi:MAG: HAMP domain-containing histidine kinase [Phycisphaerales bacterium]|nr:MAG: HAMP domain-containing histidine kinase [Phycisphaerales bacterium]
MASILEKRFSLHRRLEIQEGQNKALESQLLGLQHLVSMGTVSYMIAHEINNLLTPLKSYASLALSDPDDRGLSEKALQKVVRNCDRTTKIIDSMLALAHGQTHRKHDVHLLALIEEVFTCLCRDFVKDGITVDVQVPEELTIRVVPVQIQQVLMNLIVNARDAMLPHGGVLSIEAAETTDSVEISVSDTGSGIEPENLENILEIFFTTKADKRSAAENSGAGLGLAFCKLIAEKHEGFIAVESEPGRGSTFKISLPKQ